MDAVDPMKYTFDKGGITMILVFTFVGAIMFSISIRHMSRKEYADAVLNLALSLIMLFWPLFILVGPEIMRANGIEEFSWNQPEAQSND